MIASRLSCADAALVKSRGCGERNVLASVRRLVLHRPRLDDLPGDLSIRATPVSIDGQGAMYEFDVRCAGGAVADGRAIVLFAAPGARPVTEGP